MNIRSRCAALAIILALSAAPAFAEPVATITGIARAIDGDGIAFGDVQIRLNGVAAPEDNSRARDPGGPEARARMVELAGGRTAICELDGEMAGKRPVGICFVEGIDIGQVMIREGLALDCPRYSGGRYAADEAAAKAGGIDLAVTYERPGYCW